MAPKVKQHVKGAACDTRAIAWSRSPTLISAARAKFRPRVRERSKGRQQWSAIGDGDGQNARAKATDADVRGMHTRLYLDDRFGIVHYSVLQLCPENLTGMYRCYVEFSAVRNSLTGLCNAVSE